MSLSCLALVQPRQTRLDMTEKKFVYLCRCFTFQLTIFQSCQDDFLRLLETHGLTGSLTSTKIKINCHAQGPNAVSPVRLGKPATI